MRGNEAPALRIVVQNAGQFHVALKGDGVGDSFADQIVANADPVQLINAVNEVWTMTSLLGFEALIRNTPVTCLGTPFYAGWGLTTDMGIIPKRRSALPTLAQLTHACLIDYPRYYGPVSKLPCPVEVALDRLTSGDIPQPSLPLRLLSKLQSLLK